MAYDDARQLTAVSYASGGAVRSFGYDSLGRTTADTLTGPGSTTLRAASYGYDANDNRLTETLAPAGLAGLAGAGSQSYGYDANDNRLTETLAPAALAGSGSQSYGYDRADRLVSWTSTGGTTTFIYTARGTRATRTAGGTTATTTFDGFDRLVSDSTSGTTTYGYESVFQNPIQDRFLILINNLCTHLDGYRK
ncbi:hypothetical protein [Frankia sp. Cj3]|uniref:hypothetical protein n=1 Tax=Frankia sp. Cj3 TaxID=2880976 RepID=UPI001EF3EA5A|nr:hypothetical protein [Frankia sp. Cj3]